MVAAGLGALGGVGVPVAADVADSSEGAGRVQVQHVGEHGGGQLGGEAGQGGPADGLGLAFVEPVLCRARRIGGGDRLVDGGEVGGEQIVVGAQQLAGAPARRAGRAAAVFVELVLGRAVTADVPAQVVPGPGGATRRRVVPQTVAARRR